MRFILSSLAHVDLLWLPIKLGLYIYFKIASTNDCAIWYLDGPKLLGVCSQHIYQTLTQSIPNYYGTP